MPTAPYRYHVYPFRGQVQLDRSETVANVAAQMQKIIDDFANGGWEFYRMEQVIVEVRPGCLGAFLGRGNTYINYDQMIFRRPVT